MMNVQGGNIYRDGDCAGARKADEGPPTGNVQAAEAPRGQTAEARGAGAHAAPKSKAVVRLCAAAFALLVFALLAFGLLAPARLANTTLEAEVLAGSAGEQSAGDAEVTLAGTMPRGARAEAFPVEVAVDGAQVVAAYDITIFDARGRVYQPTVGSIDVSIADGALDDAVAQGAGLAVYHMLDDAGTLERIALAGVEDGTVRFEAASFSIYLVLQGADGAHNLLADVLDKDSVHVAYTFNFYAEGDGGEGHVALNTQTLIDEDVLDAPGVPEKSHEEFDGWFAVVGEGVYRYEFEDEAGNPLTVADNIAAWRVAAAAAGVDFAPGTTIDLYADYDHVYYVYFMTEQVAGTASVIFHAEHYVFDAELGVYGALDLDDASNRYNLAYIEANTQAVTGWYYLEEDAQTGGSTRHFVEDGDAVTRDMVLYPAVEGAVWVYFDLGEAAGAEGIEPIYVLGGQALVGQDALPAPTCAGYRFDGWYTAAEGGVQVVPGTDLHDLETTAGTVVLYARWTPVEAGYEVITWLQKVDGTVEEKTDGSDRGVYEDYYDYGETFYVSAGDADALVAGTSVAAVMDAGSWAVWTGYGTNQTAEEDSAYYGFEYAQARTEAELSASDATISGDSTTVINIYYDRITITWNFYGATRVSADSEPILTLVGLYGSPLEAWPTPSVNGATSASWVWRYNYYKDGATAATSVNNAFEAIFVFKATGTSNPLSTVDFSVNQRSSADARGTVEIYRETLDVGNADTSMTVEGTTRFYDRYTSFKRNVGSYGIVEKFFGCSAAGYTAGTASTEGAWIAVSVKDGVNTAIDGAPADSQVVRIYYNLNEYTLHLASNGREFASFTYQYGETIGDVLPDAAAMNEAAAADESLRPHAYYVFSQWCSDPEGLDALGDISDETMPPHDVICYAGWVPKTITVTFTSKVPSNLDAVIAELGGEVLGGEGSVKVTAGKTVAEPAALTYAGSAGRWAHVGWVNKTTGKVFSFWTALYEDTVLEALWKDEYHAVYTMTYDLNLGGQVDHEGKSAYAVADRYAAGAEEVMLEVEEAFSLDAAQVAHFICWNTEPDGTGVDYYPEALYTFDEDNLVLYAKWYTERPAATLTLSYNYPAAFDEQGRHADEVVEVSNLAVVDLGGVDAQGEPVCAYAPDETITAADGTVYRFEGWSARAVDPEAAGGDDVDVAPDALITVDALGGGNVLYAVWVAVEDDVDEDSDDAGAGDAGDEDATAPSGEGDDESAPEAGDGDDEANVPDEDSDDAESAPEAGDGDERPGDAGDEEATTTPGADDEESVPDDDFDGDGIAGEDGDADGIEGDPDGGSGDAEAPEDDDGSGGGDQNEDVMPPSEGDDSDFVGDEGPDNPEAIQPDDDEGDGDADEDDGDDDEGDESIDGDDAVEDEDEAAGDGEDEAAGDGENEATGDDGDAAESDGDDAVEDGDEIPPEFGDVADFNEDVQEDDAANVAGAVLAQTGDGAAVGMRLAFGAGILALAAAFASRRQVRRRRA